MATRESVEDYMQKCTEAYNYAKAQFESGAKQEHYHDLEYTEAQSLLENAVNDLNKLTLSCDDQQKEQLYRMRLQLQQLQNEMILQRH
ncbi:YtzC family protein [Metabacillus sp. 84]|uniref:YtzC family protein n=1 Tax=unclassified Metabacillus TaxID=2675274 RepID=UPI003CF53D78